MFFLVVFFFKEEAMYQQAAVLETLMKALGIGPSLEGLTWQLELLRRDPIPIDSAAGLSSDRH